MQQVVFSVTAIAFIILAVSGGIRLLAGLGDETDFIQAMVESIIRFTEITKWVGLLIGLLAAAGNFMLLRRVQIKEAV
jgi:hypothetical protein